MKTHGLIMGKFLTLMLFMSILVLFTVLPTFPPNVNILEGNTSGPLENRQEKKEK